MPTATMLDASFELRLYFPAITAAVFIGPMAAPITLMVVMNMLCLKTKRYNKNIIAGASISLYNNPTASFGASKSFPVRLICRPTESNANIENGALMIKSVLSINGGK